MLIDRAIIEVSSGKGGDGKVGFRRAKYVPKGGPNGGDAGNGGDVILAATAGIDTLLDFSGRRNWEAENGEDGGIKQCHGKNGENLIVQIPPGTLVYDEVTGELLADMDAPGKQLLVAKGGRGGFGNEHFKTPVNQAPREATPGAPGEQRTLRLELKLIADIGLVGKPNAGKSTLLSRVSKARPKIADYPFTTLEPNLGIAELSPDRRLVFADIPGLIEGVHEGHGLGIEFLRHIERTRLLVHLLEIEPTDGSDPVVNYQVVCKELASYSPELAEKKQIIALTKMDMLGSDEDRQAAVEMIEQAIGCKVVPISSASGVGLRDLMELCWRELEQIRAREQVAASVAAVAGSGGNSGAASPAEDAE